MSVAFHNAYVAGRDSLQNTGYSLYIVWLIIQQYFVACHSELVN